MSLTLYTDIAELITNRGAAKKGGAAITEDDLGIIRDGALLHDSKKGILWMGHTDDVPKKLTKSAKKVSLKGKILSPAFTDCHTHLVYGGSRHDEFRMKLDGATYQQIAASGGGIVSSVKATRRATEAELYKTAQARLEECIRYGVGIIEIKSGYGLDWNSEYKLLKVIAKLKRQYKNKVVIQSTFLGAHDFPPEAKTGREKVAYVREITSRMLPKIKKEKLADAVDVFMDEGYYTRAQTRKILQQAHRLGFEIKIHADELKDTGAAALAAELGALSADHLLKANEAGIQKMAKRAVVGVLLPGTAFYLRLPYANAKRMRAAGMCMALATDYNPGSSPTMNLPFIMTLACLQMGMTTAEAFVATTYGGARALGYHNQHGFLRVGSKPKMAIFNVPSYVSLITNFAHAGFCEKVFG